jgi:acid phosphatase (class A)
MTKLLSLTLLALLYSLTPALADWTRIPSSDFGLPPFPKEGSARYKKDFELLHEYQESRDREQCALGLRQVHPTYEAIYMSADSPLSGPEAEAAQDLVSRVMKLTDKISTYHKGKFMRPRPYDVDTSLEPCGRKPGGAKSYPSSHAANAMAGACVLAKIYPRSKKLILDYGRSSGDLRAVIGVHHPSDVEAGQNLGNEICGRLLADDGFLEELAKVKD